MDACQVFLKSRGMLFRIKTVYMKKLTRPVVEPPCGIKNPAADPAKALRFGQIELASLQVSGVLPQLFFCARAALDVDARSMPLENSSISGAQREFMVQHPAIFAISPPHSCDSLEALSRSDRLSPPLHKTLDIFRMNPG